MKPQKLFFVLTFSFLLFHSSFAQDITTDTTLANRYFELAKINFNSQKFDSANYYLDKAQPLYVRHLGENCLKNSHVLNMRGTLLMLNQENDSALIFYFQSLNIRMNQSGEKSLDAAGSYNNIGIVYYREYKLDLATEYFQKSLHILTQIIGLKNGFLADTYDMLGAVAYDKSDFSAALNYGFKTLNLQKEIYGEKHSDVARSYEQIGMIYKEKGENDKALEYCNKSLSIRKILFEKAKNSKDTISELEAEWLLSDVAQSLLNLGTLYEINSDYDRAMENYLLCAALSEDLVYEKEMNIAGAYSCVANIFNVKGLYNSAFDYYFKSLEIYKKLYGDLFSSTASIYKNIGLIYKNTDEYIEAEKYYFKALQIQKNIFGEKHSLVSDSYIEIGNLFRNKNESSEALKCYHKACASSLPEYNDTLNTYSIPLIKKYLNWKELLQALQSKAQIFADTSKTLPKFQTLAKLEERLQLAFRHYQVCDTLIDLTRKEITGLSDKIALAEQASEIYEAAIPLCENLKKISKNSKDKKYYDEMAFYFSEKNKSSVLLEALAGQEALKFTGIPADLLKKERNLKTDISYYTKQLAEQENLDSIQISKFQNMLFDKNRSYDSLIIVFETRYPKYHELKYNSKPVSLNEIQKQLDRRTALISYTMSDSSISIFTIRRNKIEYQESKLPINFNDSILLLRKSMTENTKKAYSDYKRLANSVYELVFPKNLDEKIENLIIIPDNVLATIPFEVLLTNKASRDEKFSELPYLLRKYNISYSYSATLFNRTFPKDKKQKPELTSLNDWLAFAPVFSDENTSGVTIASRELLRRMKNLSNDTTATRGMLYSTGTYITPLPGTENEVKTILTKFDQKKLNAKIELNDNATEELLKSDEIKKYKMLHFATHGFVNSEKPELSGLLLAQIPDTTITETDAELNTGKEQNDGILYSGEIYNLELNADLVVLSACETGLGKIKKGEGIIGLTRALLYAGAKNIVVSLWQVSDESTSQLMINFYDNILENGLKNPNYSNSLQKAKLKMISEGKYAHPFFWSPFILIGK